MSKMQRVSGAEMRIKELYKKEVIKKMRQKFNFKNDLAVPRISKIVINCGVGSISSDKKMFDNAVEDIVKITGQKPFITKSKKAISGFKLRKGQNVGLKITLRGKRMYDFLEKVINIALPRSRDFKGIISKFDGKGNLTTSFREQIVFPEIEEGTEKIFGFEATIVTSAKNDGQAKELLSLLGLKYKE